MKSFFCSIDTFKQVYDLTRASSEQAATSVGGEQKDRKITELEAKVLRLDEKRKALEQQCRQGLFDEL